MAETLERERLALAYTTLGDERTIERLEVEGEIPAWLDGSLLRNGPADFEPGGRPVRHQFDGLAMLHRFSFAGGEVSYANRFLRGRAWRAAREGRLAYSEFATDPCRTLFQRVQTLFAPRSGMTDNAAVNVARLGERFVAMTETPIPLQFDPATLETLGVAPPPPGTLPTAHPHHDADTGELLGYATRVGPRSRYLLYAQDATGRTRTIASVPAREPSYMHSFGLTERFAVLIGQPLVLRPLDLALGRRPFIESFRWEPERGTAFHVIDRRAGRHVGTWHGDPFFCFHTINAFEEGDEIVLDLVAWEDASVIDGLYLDRVRAFGPRMPRNRPLRLRIDLRGEAAVRSQELAPVALEMPRIDYARCNTRPYRYCYGWGAGDGDEWQAGRVVKVDVTSGRTETWEQLGVAPGEPVYVPAPDARDEDDGVLLSLCLDVLQGFSFLLVLDAETLAERGRARLPHHVPLGLHGDFFAGVSAR